MNFTLVWGCDSGIIRSVGSIPPRQRAYCEHNGINSTSFATASLFPQHHNPCNEKTEGRKFSSALKAIWVHIPESLSSKGEVIKKQDIILLDWLQRLSCTFQCCNAHHVERQVPLFHGYLCTWTEGGAGRIHSHTWSTRKGWFGNKMKLYSNNHISKNQIYHTYSDQTKGFWAVFKLSLAQLQLLLDLKDFCTQKKSIMPAVYRVCKDF